MPGWGCALPLTQAEELPGRESPVLQQRVVSGLRLDKKLLLQGQWLGGTERAAGEMEVLRLASALPAVAVDTTLCVEWKEVKALSPLSVARPLPRLVRQASFDSQDFLQVPPSRPCPAEVAMCRYPMAGHPSWPWPCQLAVARGCSDVSHEPGCILGEISPRCLVAMAMQFVARLQIPHRFPRGHGLRAWHGRDSNGDVQLDVLAWCVLPGSGCWGAGLWWSYTCVFTSWGGHTRVCDTI